MKTFSKGLDKSNPVLFRTSFIYYGNLLAFCNLRDEYIWIEIFLFLFLFFKFIFYFLSK